MEDTSRSFSDIDLKPIISDSSSPPVSNLSAEHIEDVKLAVSKMGRVNRRPRQACAQGPGVCRHRGAGRAHHGRHPQPQRLPAAPGAQGQAPKKIPLTDAIFANLRCKDDAGNDPSVTRVSIDCQATVNMGRYSRGGMTRGGHKAADHDMGCREKYTLFGAVNEDSRELYLHVGSSAKTSDFIVDGLQAWWEHSPTEARERCSLLLIKVETSITGWSKTAYFARWLPGLEKTPLWRNFPSPGARRTAPRRHCPGAARAVGFWCPWAVTADPWHIRGTGFLAGKEKGPRNPISP